MMTLPHAVSMLTSQTQHSGRFQHSTPTQFCRLLSQKAIRADCECRHAVLSYARGSRPLSYRLSAGACVIPRNVDRWKGLSVQGQHARLARNIWLALKDCIHTSTMDHYFLATLVLLACYIIYTCIHGVLLSCQHVRRAAQFGCRPVPMLPHRYPLGIDTVWRLIKADRNLRLPTEFEQMTDDMSCATFGRWRLCKKVFMTSDPKNIQAILATQFLDFDIGSDRRGNFAPMLGHGIFTSDGESWYVSWIQTSNEGSYKQFLMQAVVGNILEHCYGLNLLEAKSVILTSRKLIFRTCSDTSQLQVRDGRRPLTSRLSSPD